MRVAKLKGRWVVVTGADAGIGRAIALDEARCGGYVAICDIDAARLNETRALLDDYEVDVIASPVDVTKRAQVKKFAALLHEKTDAVDILVNNAGVVIAADILDTTAKDWEFIIGVNLMGVIHLCHALCPAMIKRKKVVMLSI